MSKREEGKKDAEEEMSTSGGLVFFSDKSEFRCGEVENAGQRGLRGVLTIQLVRGAEK